MDITATEAATITQATNLTRLAEQKARLAKWREELEGDLVARLREFSVMIRETAADGRNVIFFKRTISKANPKMAELLDDMLREKLEAKGFTVNFFDDERGEIRWPLDPNSTRVIQ